MTAVTNDDETEQQARVFKALADPTRLRIAQILAARGEMSGTEIAEKTGISMALLCHHWSILADAGLLKKRKDGQTTYATFRRDVLKGCLGVLMQERPEAG